MGKRFALANAPSKLAQKAAKKGIFHKYACKKNISWSKMRLTPVDYQNIDIWKTKSEKIINIEIFLPLANAPRSMGTSWKSQVNQIKSSIIL